MWTHGGGSSGSIGLAATGVATGQANYVAVIRSMAETDPNSRLNVAVNQGGPPAMCRVNGLVAPAQLMAIEAEHSFYDGLSRDALWAFVEASYYHANRNPNAYGRGMTLDREDYDNARMPAEPLKLFDNSRENDKAIALIVASAERAKDLKQKPAYILSSVHGRYGGRDHSFSESPDGRHTSGFRAVARRMWEQSGYKPTDVDVTQVYSNTSIFGLIGMIDHGLVTWDNVNDELTLENLIAPSGKLPINTAGGDLADGFLHGAGNNIEGVRQIRGTSANQVPDANLSLIFGGPNDSFTSTTLLGSEATL
jgi:acetyl-CoA acetyltransferase